MRLAAVYISENSMPYVFGKNHIGQTLNLGGEYLYEMTEINGKTKISKKVKNSHFIENFWENNIIQISAIVGVNGSGKSKILELIKIGCELVIENGKKSDIVWSHKAGQFLFHTPYLTENRASEDNDNVFNLSKLSQIKNDTRHENMDFNGHWEYHNSERLKRTILFIENEIFKKKFDDLNITTFDNITIKFLKIAKEDWNTSRNFSPYFSALKKIKDAEWTNTEIQLQEKFKITEKEELETNSEYHKESQKLRLRLTVLESIILKVHSILEATGNKFLEEGFIEGKAFPLDDEFKKIKSTKDAFFWFIRKAYFELRGNKFYLPINEIENFVNIILRFAEKDNAIDNYTVLTVDFKNTKEIFDAYQSFLISFKDVFTYDETVFITFHPDKSLSTGEMSFYELFSSLSYANYRIQNRLDVENYKDPIKFNNYIFLLDESDLGFHPYWKRKYIKFLCDIVPTIFTNKTIQFIITTHDPLTLSDIPNNNIVYLKKEKNITKILSLDENERPMKSFGANISDLLSNSFFIEDGLIGEFAKNKIQDVIEYINGDKNRPDKNWISSPQIAKKVIDQIGEPYLFDKLNEMFLEVFPEFKDDEIKRLEEKLIRLKNGTN